MTARPAIRLRSSRAPSSRRRGQAASAALAAYWLGGQTRRARSLGIVGTGLVARYVYEFLVDTGWSIDELWLYDLSPVE